MEKQSESKYLQNVANFNEFLKKSMIETTVQMLEDEPDDQHYLDCKKEIENVKIDYNSQHDLDEITKKYYSNDLSLFYREIAFDLYEKYVVNK